MIFKLCLKLHISSKDSFQNQNEVISALLLERADITYLLVNILKFPMDIENEVEQSTLKITKVINDQS